MGRVKLMSKICAGCGVEKPRDAFYDGRRLCKTCLSLARKEEYWADPEAARAKARNQPSAKRFAKYVREWREKNPGKQRAYYQRWAAKNREKQRAHSLVRNALRKGTLQRQPCEQCGATERVQAHHDDYAKPLEVRWLCLPCHRQHHHEQRRREQHDNRP